MKENKKPELKPEPEPSQKMARFRNTTQQGFFYFLMQKPVSWEIDSSDIKIPFSN